MKKIRVIKLAILIITLTLEIFGKGAVLVFGNPEGADWYKTYSYFSMIPFGYANFGPFIAAILTCVLLLLSIIALFKNSKKICKAIFIISCIAVLISLSQLLYGLRYFNTVSLAISILLIMFTGINFYVLKSRKQ